MGPYQSFDEQCGALSRTALGDQAYDAAFAEGVESGLDQMIKYVLQEKPTAAARGRKAIKSGALTKRQQEIAELVARGMINNEIAEALVIGRRTVESHVENILATLWVDSRAQIASCLVGQTS